MNAIDTPYTVDGNVRNLLSAGYHGIIRYISPSTARFPNKRLTPGEVASIQSVPGMAIGLVWESDPTSGDYFSSDQGTGDANDALAVLAGLAAPQSVPVFFAVDYDASDDDIQGPITDYFTAIQQGVFGPAGNLLGVYGSGATCLALKSAGVVQFTWLAQSRGWAGYQNWKPAADVIQGPSTQISGIDLDTDYVVNEAVLWNV